MDDFFSQRSWFGLRILSGFGLDSRRRDTYKSEADAHLPKTWYYTNKELLSTVEPQLQSRLSPTQLACLR